MKRKLPSISIITPSYNQSAFIGETIQSVLSQSYPHLQYIIMDGGSTDETRKILTTFGKKIHWISRKDRGQSDAINKGFLKAKGDPEYDAEVVEHAPTSVFSNDSGSSNDSDPMLAAAKECVIRAGKASASLLQRRLRLGYARAARMLDLLEEQGIIGPADGARPRDVLVKADNAPYARDAENDIVEESNDESTGQENITEHTEEDTPELSKDNENEDIRE